jgi:hypothetical protein
VRATAIIESEDHLDSCEEPVKEFRFEDFSKNYEETLKFMI